MAGDKHFGKHLQSLRELNKYTQEQLAEIVGVEYQTISRIETGLYFTSYENLKKIAKALRISVKDLFDFMEEDQTKAEILKSISKDLKAFNINDLRIIRRMINLYSESKRC